MVKHKIWLSTPHMGGNEISFVNEAFKTNWVAPLGANVDGFEHDIETYTKAKYAAALSSGTASIHIALIMLGVNPGDFVICQSMTFSASANPIAHLGAIPVFVDSEDETWNMSPIFLEEAIKYCISSGKKPKAIIPVHIYGMPAKIDELTAIAQNYDIPIIEDAAESLGSTYNGIPTGTFGIMGILSFNGNKIITTSGGGALISNHEEFINKARFLATQARDNAPHYQHSQIGYNYRMSNILAGIGRGQMEVLPERVSQRRATNKWYREFLSDFPGISFQSEPNEDYYSNFWLTAITISANITGVSREQVRLKLLKDNIESRPLWKPMHLQPVFKDSMYFGNGVSGNLFDIGLCLPSSSNLTEEEKNRIKESLFEALS
jgi:dTDP-4-amino-4,6-dideoxygalactose transaminase